MIRCIILSRKIMYLRVGYDSDSIFFGLINSFLIESGKLYFSSVRKGFELLDSISKILIIPGHSLFYLMNGLQ